MIFYNIMRYSTRLIVARHGFESVTLRLAEDTHSDKDLLSRHHIPITRRLVIEELAEIRASDHDPAVIRRVMEARSSAYEENRHTTPAGQLRQTLAGLEMALDNLSAGKESSQTVGERQRRVASIQRHDVKTRHPVS